MKNFSSNFDKIEKYEYDNEYEFKIKSFAKKHNCNFFDNMVIEYAIRLKNEIINSLDKNSSNADRIKVKYIKWIEKYLDEVHENLIERKMKISTIIKKQKDSTNNVVNLKFPISNTSSVEVRRIENEFIVKENILIY